MLLYAAAISIIGLVECVKEITHDYYIRVHLWVLL